MMQATTGKHKLHNSATPTEARGQNR